MSAETIAALDLAAVRSDRVLALLARYLPQAKHGTGAHDDWLVAGPALIARAARALQAIRTLRPGLFNLDAGVLLRSMFEYIVTFAWFAADPAAYAPLWVKADRVQRVRGDNDWACGGFADSFAR